MTLKQLEEVAGECVTRWFEQMKATGEIPPDADPREVAWMHARAVDSVMSGLSQNHDLRLHLLAGSRSHAAGAIDALILRVSIQF